MNDHFLNQLLIQQTSQGYLSVNRSIINLIIPLSNIHLKKIISQIANYINVFEIYSLSINSMNYKNIFYTDNKITPFIFYLLPQITFNKTLKEIIIYDPMEEAILGLRFMNLLRYSSLNFIRIKSFNITLSKQQHIWQLGLINSHFPLSSNVTSKLEKMKELIQLRKRKKDATIASEEILLELNPSKKQKTQRSHGQPLLITWHFNKRKRVESLDEPNLNEQITAKISKLSLNPTGSQISDNTVTALPSSSYKRIREEKNTSSHQNTLKKNRIEEQLINNFSSLSVG